MKIEEIRKLSEKQIEDKIFVIQKELFDKKIKLDLSKLKDTSVIRKYKKTIARMKTVLNEIKKKK
ncbi:MAG: 50S ribosomal protein L29 [Candidatus Phytoplasma cynodontis]|uniref:50S ribosomal protein L29 n=1 Tax='Cynodon dactylon' phytoplasma TaxID=295320 RepID=UPI001265B5EC|nr:50S ribosomal protein L29 ['Cynodon dactylon' phytoplasma]KAB8121979.1 50S ribosomal protein L29 ['Cynodon dactylon' phytoplasma]WIA07607.1 MAG: 50S ribosomal protein L29 [Candidatus Phytoplasma cynodontis]